MKDTVNVFWFRRDLRLNDNHGLFEALKSGLKVMPVFIFDVNILDKLPSTDARVAFIHQRIHHLNKQLSDFGSRISVFYGNPSDIFSHLIANYKIGSVFTNHDYEPYAKERDNIVSELLKKSGIGFRTYKDQVLFEPGEIVKPDGTPYTVYTPYSKKWLAKLQESGIQEYRSETLIDRFIGDDFHEIPSLAEMGFHLSTIDFLNPEIPETLIRNYAETRNYPGLDSTSRLGVHLRFGTISVRDCIRAGQELSKAWLNELIWREFFMQILGLFPRVVNNAFKPVYERIQWQNYEELFSRWCEGKTGYPLVDAGMRELALTGFMHNRVRMVVASFLTKHLLIDWRWGEAWFAERLLDYELSSNNGNWQWAAGCGCDAAPYFRIFNPLEQARKFDPDSVYIRKWIPEFGTDAYPLPVIDHAWARKRCLAAFKSALKP